MDPTYPTKKQIKQENKTTTNLLRDSNEQLIQSQSNLQLNINTSGTNNNSNSSVGSNINNNNNKKKWKCIQCTYENWPLTLKCTICLASKSLSVSSSSNSNLVKSKSSLNQTSNNIMRNNSTKTKMSLSNNNSSSSSTQGPPISNKLSSTSSTTTSFKNDFILNDFSKVKLKDTSNEFMLNNINNINNNNSNNNNNNIEWQSSSTTSSNENLTEDNIKNNKYNFLNDNLIKSNDIYKIGNLMTTTTTPTMTTTPNVNTTTSNSGTNNLTNTISLNQQSNNININNNNNTKSLSNSNLSIGNGNSSTSSSSTSSSGVSGTGSCNETKIDIREFLTPEEINVQSIEKQKWSCSVCTYLNWPKSKKCVQCCSPKLIETSLSSLTTTTTTNPNPIEPSIVDQQSTNLIDSATLITATAATTTLNQSTTDSVISSNDGEKQIDTNNLKIISQIESVTTIPASTATTTTIATTATTSSVPSPKHSPPTRSLCNSPCTVPKSQNQCEQQQIINTGTGSIDIYSTNEVPLNDNTTVKWSCSACTYQNWPKSQRCVMCHVSRNNTIITTTPATTTTTTTITNNNNNNINSNSNNLIKKSNSNPTSNPSISSSSSSSTYSSSSSTNNNSSLKNIQLNQKPLNNNNSNLVQQQNNFNLLNNKQIEQQQKLKNYQIQMDRLFLAACQGIVDGDMSHLHRYLNAGGDLTRYLTSEEVKLLNRPNVFTVGLTILHLCFQYKRKEFLMKIINKTSITSSNKISINSKNLTSVSNSSSSSSSSSSSNINLLNALLKQVNKTKFSPCQSCPTLASNIVDRYFTASLRQRKTPNHHNYYSSYNNHHNLNHQYHHYNNNNHHHNHHHRSHYNDQSLIGATNATLFNAHHNSPTSSLISLNNANTNLLNSSTSTNQAFLTVTMSPSPSPPPQPLSQSQPPAMSQNVIGATSSSSSSNLSSSTSSSSFNHQSQSLCFYVNECHTFMLPNEIDDFSSRIQHILFDELLDREVQQELEYESRIINWNIDLCKRLNSRLYPLWNRHSGDCLLDSVLQACYGVFDTDNTLRRVMAESLEQYSNFFKPRWKEHEILMAQSLDYTLDDYQLEHDWNNIISLANQPGASLEQAHIFALCHIFRRPIIIYSVKYVKSFRGENIGFTHFEGVYLPLIWEPNFCFKSPIALGYTRGHFTALVPLERNEITTYISNSNSTSNNGNMVLGAVSQLENSETQNNQQIFYLPLANNEGQLLPVHFLNSSELGRERSILRQYLQLDCFVMQGSNCGLLAAQQRVAKRGMLVKQMLDEWLSYYRNMQLKEMGQQIEISQEKENDNKNNKENLNLNQVIEEDEDDDDDDEDDDDEDDDDDDDEDDDDEVDDDDDDDEEEEEENEYCEEVNVEEI